MKRPVSLLSVSLLAAVSLWLPAAALAPSLAPPAFGSAFGSAPLAGAQEALVGAWHAETYVLQDGPRHEVDGMIFFTPRDWTVLFFVLDEQQEPRRGSAEGGTYVLEGELLTFRHLYNASGGAAVEGLAASEWSMQIRAAADAATEPCRIEIAGDRLTIHFPSGNHMLFTRSS